MSACTNHGKTISAKTNSGRKSTLTERDRRIYGRNVSKNHKITSAQVTAKLNIHEDPVSIKTVRSELYKSNIHHRAAIAKPLLTESNAQMQRWCHDHKTWTVDNRKVSMI
jgi:hypothetical protein